MSNHDVKNVKHGAIMLANNLRTGLTVYLQSDGDWSTLHGDAWIINDDKQAEQARALGAHSAEVNEVMDPYLVATTQEGKPTHIREYLRITGPSINYRCNTQ